MGVSADAPYFDMAYKMVKYADRPVLKLSPGKKTLVGDKQVFRFKGGDGKLKRDVIGLRDDEMEQGEPLLRKVMEKGKVVIELPSLTEIQKTFFDEFAQLDEKYKTLERRASKYSVQLSSRLRRLQAKVVRELKERELGEKDEEV